MSRRRVATGALASLVSLALAGLMAAAPVHAGPQGEEQAAGRPGKPVSVMTRNIYLGADINRPIRAAAAARERGADAQAVMVALANATHETRAVVDATDFPRRSELLADEIAETRPDLIGLQEVALWRSGDLELEPDKIGEPNAEHVDYDFLAMLLQDLAEEGVEYESVSTAWRADVEAPSFPGDISTAFGPDARDVRMTMRDVILKRLGSRLEVIDEGQKKYAVNLPVDILGRQLDFGRGYNWVDVDTRRGGFRFINTHLEAFSSDIAYAQASELLAVPANREGDTVLVCDCNSDPLDNTIKDHDSLPHKAPYELLTGSGFTDMWVALDTDDPGWTAGLSETVDDETPEDIDHRIDLVLARSTDGSPVWPDKGEITGDDPEDRDELTGLWPSDHAGVVVRLRGLR